MKRIINSLIVAIFVAAMTQFAVAGEHGGKGSTTDKAMATAPAVAVPVDQEVVTEAVKTTPSNEDIRATMKAYVEAQAQNHGGTYYIKDPDTGAMLGLTMERIHERVGKTGDYYYSCADFKDQEGMIWDLDIDVEDKDGTLSVVDVRIHKEDGVPSYTYDDQDNRHPLAEGTKRHLGKKGNAKEMMNEEHKGSMKGSMNDAMEEGANMVDKSMAANN